MCSGLAKPTFQDMTNRNDKWYFRDCYSDIFPFHQLENKKLENLFENKKDNACLLTYILFL